MQNYDKGKNWMSEQKIKRVKFVIGPEPRVKLEFESGDFLLFDPMELLSDIRDVRNETHPYGSD